MQLTEHFSLEELTMSDIAPRLGIDNTVGLGLVRGNLTTLARALEAARAALGNHPIHVCSGYRSAALNLAVHGSKNSAHRQGLAADIICPGFGEPLAVCRALAAQCDFDQIIYEGNWCHFAVTAALGRRELLTAHFNEGGTTYTEGLVTT